MRSIVSFFISASFIFVSQTVHSQENQEPLSNEEISMAKIAALTAVGDLKKLSVALNDGLNNGLTINKVKEELVHLYAYSGFPRSLMAINTLTEILKDREEKGIKDEIGEKPKDLKKGDKYEIGKQVLADLTGVEDRPTAGYAKTLPIIEVFLKEHLFADIFKRGVLTYKEREIATVAALISMGDLGPMARGHMGIAMRQGVTEKGMNSIIDLISDEISADKANRGRELLNTFTHNSDTIENEKHQDEGNDSVFPRGEMITASVFTGTAYLTGLVEADEFNQNAVGVVTFEAGARSFWHQHPNGQIIIALSGEGYYQEKGSAKRILRKGDVAKCPINTPHWHGAGPNEEFVQIAITGRADGPTEWMEEVTETEYKN